MIGWHWLMFEANVQCYCLRLWFKAIVMVVDGEAVYHGCWHRVRE